MTLFLLANSPICRFFQIENEKIVAQKEKELELLRANAGKELHEQDVSFHLTP